MNKKPIKRNKHIVQLSKDHHLTLLFCWKIKIGLKFYAETNRIINYVDYFWQTHIQPHFKDEEAILFNPVKDNAVKKALDEHTQIKQQVYAIIRSENIQSSQLSNLADIVENHVRYEERELFPHLEKVLTENQLQQIGEALQRTHCVACKDEFADEFWIKK